MRARLDQIVFDCHEPRTLVRFWAGLVGGDPVDRGLGWAGSTSSHPACRGWPSNLCLRTRV